MSLSHHILVLDRKMYRYSCVTSPPINHNLFGFTRINLSSSGPGTPLPSVLLVKIYNILSGPTTTSRNLPNSDFRCSTSVGLLRFFISYNVFPFNPAKKSEL